MKTTSLSDEQRELLKKVMIKAFISSEESGEETTETREKRAVLMIKPLPWRASRVDRFFKQLDRKGSKQKSKQSKQQTLQRVIGCTSTRPKPPGFADDFFGFAQKDSP